jgi:DNA primase
MSPIRLPDGFVDELKARLRLSDYVGRKVKLKRQGKDLVGLSPFTNEKSPSFYVIDDKRMFHDFSSGKSGDIVTWLMETERLSFMEAVERLATDAGMSLPRAAPEAQAEMATNARLYRVLEAACAAFEAHLRSAAGQEARNYLGKRGLHAQAWEKYRLGFAPDGWRTLSEALKAAGHSQDDLVAAGLSVMPEGGGREPYDRFRNRVMFPIEDVRGRVVAFGARALDPDAKPKYLNSSEGALFHKGQQLYNYRRARAAMGTGKVSGLIVAEGYMDVIALSEAGFGHAVAPLGTALTEDQLRLIWQAGPEPVLCFDGDAAGQRAAFRAIDRAMPHLGPGQSVFFARLPGGLDPDDLIRREGPDAMGRVLREAVPLVDMLWQREKELEPLDTPERQAGLEARLSAAVKPIRDGNVRAAYERELRSRSRELFFQLRRARHNPQTGTSRPVTDTRAGGQRVAELRSVQRAQEQAGLIAGLRGVSRRGLGLLVRCADSPDLLDRALEALAAAEFSDLQVARIRDALFDLVESCGKVDRERLARHLRSLGNAESVRLLESYPVSPSLDLMSPEGREWLIALEQFGAELGLREEARRVREGDELLNAAPESFAASHEARRRLVAERHALRAQARDAAEDAQRQASVALPPWEE